jgi:hypothetical protein
MIPYLLGFEPRESIVVVSLQGGRRRFGPIVRGDLVPAEQADALVEHLMRTVDTHGFTDVVVVAYSTRPVAADAVVSRLVAALDGAGVAVFEALRADGSRWWSYTCDRGCCPADGAAYDPAASSIAAWAVAAGLGKAPSREALAEQFAPRSDAVRAAVGAAAQATFVTLTIGDGPDAMRVDDLLRLALGGCYLDPETLGTLLGAVQDSGAQELAWLLMTRADAERHFEVWRQVMNAADPELLPPAGSLCAFAAWLSGRGALADVVAERVAEADPDHRLLVLVRDLLAAGVCPDVWDERRETVTTVSGDWLEAGAAEDDTAG